MCLPCLIIMQSCYCDYRINKTLSPLDLRSLLFSRDLDVLRTQRIIGFYLNYPQINELGESDHSNYILCYVMLCFTVLCCAVQCYAILYYTILPYGIVLYCTALRCAVLYCALLCCAVLRCAALCCAVLYCAVLCCAVLRCAVLRCAVLCCTALCCVCCAVLCCVLYYTNYITLHHCINEKQPRFTNNVRALSCNGTVNLTCLIIKI